MHLFQRVLEKDTLHSTNSQSTNYVSTTPLMEVSSLAAQKGVFQGTNKNNLQIPTSDLEIPTSISVCTSLLKQQVSDGGSGGG